ncbi:MAG: DNA polymerase I [Flavobacteriaceae bacterium]|nr:DNA polymerase I [Flavobacteriaceae bacterium]|tara:strand:- start:1814 stop:4540 length:2727 start_codon:yes stop_codon:yes gene_type:complete
MNKKKRLFLIDAYALIFRGYYAFIKNPRINSKGLDTSAILGFTNSLFDVIKRESPDYLAVCFDKGGSHDRIKIFDQYKANRDETPEAIKISVPIIEEILKSLNISILVKEGYEADDIIGTIAKKAKSENFETYMVTPDKDFAQLVDESTYMYRPVFGGGYETWGVSEVLEKFEICQTSQVIDFLAMKGDSVDNIPGLPGVGDKTAKKFLKQFGSLEGLLQNTSELKGKLKEKIEQNKELGILSKKLATIITDVPINYNIEELEFNVTNLDKAREIFVELEFRRIVNSLNSILLKNNEKYKSELQKIEKENNFDLNPGFGQFNLFENNFKNDDKNKLNVIYQYIESDISAKLFLKKLEQQVEVSYHLNTEKNGDYEITLKSISFCWQNDVCYVLKSDIKKFDELIKIFFENDKVAKISNDLKFDIKALCKKNITILGDIFDIKLAHYLINPDISHDLINLSNNYLNISVNKKFEELKDFEVSCLTYKLKNLLKLDLEKFNQIKLYNEIEIPLLKTLAKMEIEGINLDVKFLKKLSEKTTNNLEEITIQIYELAGGKFNISSPKQLGEVLFDKMKIISNPKKTKTGQYSTSEEVLNELSSKSDLVKLVLKFRSISKLLNTYINSLPKQLDKSTNRIHTEYVQTVASTGRLSSINPNLQNIPIRTNRGREIRKAFIARSKDYFLMAADYSQIELRIIASLSNEENMMNAFKNKEDIHASTASAVFNVPLNQVSKEQRSNAKVVNFGIIYGVSAFGLSNQTNLNRTESKELIEKYFEKYPKLKQYMNNQISYARNNGYVETVLGRRRYLKGINSQNSVVRGAAERNAINAPVQGSAADIIKIAMINIQKRLSKGNYKSKMLLQIHDELVFDVFKPELNEMIELTKNEMEKAFEINVPLTVDLNYGLNWLEAH